jgi:hypothetical protein
LYKFIKANNPYAKRAKFPIMKIFLLKSPNISSEGINKIEEIKAVININRYPQRAFFFPKVTIK